MYKIGVYGSAVASRQANAERAREIGRQLGTRECTVITGACSGLPYLAAAEAARAGRDIHGFSPVNDLEQQL